MIVKAIRDVLVADTTVTAALATYDFGDASEGPAVFTFDPVPNDASLPAIAISQVSGSRWGTQGNKGGEADVDVMIWGDKKRSWKALRELSWAVWTALERAHLSLSGYDEIGCMADLPAGLTDEDGFPGYMIRLTVRFLEV